MAQKKIYIYNYTYLNNKTNNSIIRFFYFFSFTDKWVAGCKKIEKELFETQWNPLTVLELMIIRFCRSTQIKFVSRISNIHLSDVQT